MPSKPSPTAGLIGIFIRRMKSAARRVIDGDRNRSRQRSSLMAVAPPPESKIWYKAGIDLRARSGAYACQRLQRDFFVPYLKPSFKIGFEDSIFVVGSCFARGIEAILKNRGFTVASAAEDFDSLGAVTSNDVKPLGLNNKYTTFSILNEFSWALEPAAKFPETCLVDLDDDRCVDPQVNPTLRIVNRSLTLERRQILRNVNARIRSCRVVIMTVSQVELWYDNYAKVHLSTVPNREMRALHPGRYHLVVSNYVQNLDNLQRLHRLLSTYGHSDLRIVVIVSPEPQQATFGAEDIVVANSYGKATLRAAVQDFAVAHSNVTYFPAYEIVTHSARNESWEPDLRHPRGTMTHHVMDVFIRNFVEIP